MSSSRESLLVDRCDGVEGAVRPEASIFLAFVSRQRRLILHN
jgi:hypothetical protein